MSYDFILMATGPSNPQLWMTLPFLPISAPLDNLSAWQQPFWERISRGTTQIDWTLSWNAHTHKDTHIHAHKTQTCKHSLTHARAVMYIIPETCTMRRACKTPDSLRPSSWNPTTHSSTSSLWCLWLPTHTHILQHWHPLPILALSV